MKLFKSFWEALTDYWSLILALWLLFGGFVSLVRVTPIGEDPRMCQEMLIDRFIFGRMFCYKDEVK